MTADAMRVVRQARSSIVSAAWVQAALLVAGLAAIVALRWSATIRGLDGLAVGAAFGVALGALAIVAGGHFRLRIRARSVLLGLAVGLALVAGAIIGASMNGALRVPGLGRPAAAFLPWALVTVIVATAEEAILRGVLFDRIHRAGGIPAAIVLTSAVFALLHVPLYGWHVVPLDLAVGLTLGGLRIATRGIVAPAIAHAVADLATWWL